MDQTCHGVSTVGWSLRDWLAIVCAADLSWSPTDFCLQFQNRRTSKVLSGKMLGRLAGCYEDRLEASDCRGSKLLEARIVMGRLAEDPIVDNS